MPSELADVAHDAHDLERVGVALVRADADHQALAERILAGEDSSGQGLVDDRHRRRFSTVAGVERAALLQGDAHRLEVAGGDRVVLRARLLTRGGRGPPFHGEPRRDVVTAAAEITPGTVRTPSSSSA